MRRDSGATDNTSPCPPDPILEPWAAWSTEITRSRENYKFTQELLIMRQQPWIKWYPDVSNKGLPWGCLFMSTLFSVDMTVIFLTLQMPTMNILPVFLPSTCRVQPCLSGFKLKDWILYISRLHITRPPLHRSDRPKQVLLCSHSSNGSSKWGQVGLDPNQGSKRENIQKIKFK